MTEELKQWYEAQFDMFNEQGYKDLLEHITEMQKNYENLRNLKNDNELWFRKGQLDILDWIVGWKDSVESSFKDLQQ